MSKMPEDSMDLDVIAPEEPSQEPLGLSDAAEEWLPDTSEAVEADAIAAPVAVPETAETVKTAEAVETDDMTAREEARPSEGPVTFVLNPYNISTLAVADAQNEEYDPEVFAETEDGASDEKTSDAAEDPEALEELEPLEFATTEETDEQLERLASALKAEEQALTEDAEAAQRQSEEEAAQLLAAQIAEDEALARELAQEADGTEMAELIDPELLAALPQLDDEGNLDLQEMESCIEALLFMLDKPVSAQKLQDLLRPSEEAEKIPFPLIQEALTSLRGRYNKTWHGIELVEVGGGYQLRTKVGRAALAKKLAKVTTQRLSSGAMETLAIVAYRQPVLKEEIDRVRGVDSSHFVRGLLDKKLIEISGRSDLPGRPMLYSTSKDFLELFGLKDLSALPPLQEIEQMVPASQSSKDEDPRVVKMRELVNQMTSDPTRLAYNPREDEAILKEIKTKVASISTTTPYLEEQKAIEKAVALAKAEGREIPDDLTLLLKKPEPEQEMASSDQALSAVGEPPMDMPAGSDAPPAEI